MRKLLPLLLLCSGCGLKPGYGYDTRSELKDNGMVHVYTYIHYQPWDDRNHYLSRLSYDVFPEQVDSITKELARQADSVILVCKKNHIK